MSTAKKLDKILDKKFEEWKIARLAGLKLEAYDTNKALAKLQDKLERVMDAIEEFDDPDRTHLCDYNAENHDYGSGNSTSTPHQNDLRSVAYPNGNRGV